MANLKTTDAAGHYKLGSWREKAFGPKPTADQLNTAHLLGCRPGKQALALAMALRDTGASAFQQVDACTLVYGESGTHNNKRRALISNGLLRLVPTPHDAAGHTVYHVELTAKGKARVDARAKAIAAQAAAGQAKPAKAKAAKGKGKKATSEPAKPVVVPASEGLTADQVTAQAAAEISQAADGVQG